MKKSILFISFLLFANASDSFYYQNGKKIKLILLQPIQNFSKIGFNKKIHFYKSKKIVVGVTNKIIIKLAQNNINKYLLDFNLTKVKKLDKNIYLVKVKDSSKTVDIANKLTKTKGVISAQPDFIKQMRKR